MNRWLILLIMLCTAPATGQVYLMDIRFLDAATEKPLAGVAICNQAGAILALSDSNGLCSLKPEQARSASFLMAAKTGYEPDTFKELSPVVYLQPLNNELQTVVIHSKKCRRFWNNNSAFVVDYLLNGRNVLVAATFSGKGPRNRLVFLNAEGALIAECRLPEEPIRLFESCTGSFYCVCATKFYPVTVTGASISIGTPYPIRLFSGLTRCEQSIDGNRFYRTVDRDHLQVNYGMMARGDTQLRPLMRFDENSKKPYSLLNISDQKAAAASYEEYQEILADWAGEDFHEAYRKELVRKMLDMGTIAHINIPLLTIGDSLLIFDYYRKQLLYYSQNGRPLGPVPVRFRWNDAQRFEFIKDNLNDRIYIHRYDNRSRQTVEELIPSAGTCSGHVFLLGKPLVENMKINGGVLFMLWQDAASHTTRQLYIQPMEP